LRAVIKISPPPQVNKPNIKVTSSVKLEGGSFQTVTHYSEKTNGFMTFNIFLP